MNRWLLCAPLPPPYLLPLLGLLIATPSSPWAPREGPEPNVRMALDTGYSFPGEFRGFDSGYGLGVAFEIEQSPGWSFLFRLGWDWLVDDPSNDPYPYDYFYRQSGFSLMNWSVGGRGYLRPHATLRPYGELDVGIRRGGSGHRHDDGLAITPRIGVAWASFGGSGLALDAGANFLARRADENLIVPVRLGIVFR